MTPVATERRLPNDWYDGVIPANVRADETTYIGSSYSFVQHRSVRAESVRLGLAAAVYEGTMFDLGPDGTVSVGDYAMINGARIICDASVRIGDYAMLSWNVLVMDSYRVPLQGPGRREALLRAAIRRSREEEPTRRARGISIGRNAWIGFDACILPGVTIGEGAVVGARSVVVADVPPFAVAAGNPARIVRQLENDEVRPAGEKSVLPSPSASF